MTTLARTDVRMLDDGGLAPFSDEPRRDLLEIIEDRHDCRATLITSPFPVEHWHEALGDPTLADAILDRLVHHASKITCQGASLRQRQARLTRGAAAESPSTAQRRCAPKMAGVAWRRWQPSRGPRGRVHVDGVDGFPWLAGQLSPELGDRHPWNMHHEAVQLDGLAQKLQAVGLAVQEAAAVLRSLAAMRAGSVVETESRSRMAAMQQELAEIKGRVAELATRFQPTQEGPARSAPPSPPAATKSRRRRRAPEIGWNISPKLMKALDDTRTRHSFPHRRALVEHFLELYRRQRAGRDIIVQRLDEDEPKRGPRQRLHFRGLMPHYHQQILAEAARAEIPVRLFIAGLCWWGLSLLNAGDVTPTGSGLEGEVRSSTC